MEYAQAYHIAQRIVAKLKPVTERICVCGSLRRRKKDDIKDIDIVVIPHRQPVRDLFGMIIGHVPTKEFQQVVNGWKKMKGEPTGKYTQRLLDDGTKLEISIAVPNNFGNLLLIRTGDWEFSKLVMTIAKQRGFEQMDGFLYKGSKQISVLEEKHYFDILGIPFVEPIDRTKDAYRGKRL